MTIPAPTPVAIALLNGIEDISDAVGGRISVNLDSVLPALRVVYIGDQDAVSDWHAAPMFQVDVWAADLPEAERLAWDLRNAWPSAVLQLFGDAAVHGRWVVQNPLPVPARISDDDSDEDTGLYRYLVTVAFRLSGVTHE